MKYRQHSFLLLYLLPIFMRYNVPHWNYLLLLAIFAKLFAARILWFILISNMCQICPVQLQNQQYVSKISSFIYAIFIVLILGFFDMARSIYDFDENQFDVEDHFEFLVPYEEGIMQNILSRIFTVQRSILNLVKHVRWSFLRKQLTTKSRIFAKSSL